MSHTHMITTPYNEEQAPAKKIKKTGQNTPAATATATAKFANTQSFRNDSLFIFKTKCMR